jgi:two-component system nitrate/nitrite response regulator NarL
VPGRSSGYPLARVGPREPEEGRPVRLLVVDDPIVHAGISHMLAGVGWLTVAGHAITGWEAVALARETKPDVALLGLPLTDSWTDRVISQLREDARDTRIVMFVSRLTPRPALAARVDGLLSRKADSACLISVLSRVVQGEQVRDPADAEAVPGTGDLERHGLTRREHDILRRVAMGETNAEIGQALGLTTNTTKTYFQRVLEKLGARNRVEAVVSASELGLLLAGRAVPRRS